MKNVTDFYGLTYMPFGKNIEITNIFETDQLKNTTAMLNLGLEGEDVILLTGSVGSGKSVSIRSFVDSLDTNEYLPIYLRGNNMNQADLYKMVLQELKVEPPRGLIKVKSLYFKTVSEMNKKPVIIIDDAQDMSENALLSIKAMVNFDQDSSSKICFVLVGQPELKQTISYSQFESLRQRIKLSVHLKGMGLEETCRYIDHIMAAAGKKTLVFSDSAKSSIHSRSEGLSRQINKICYQALISGAIEQREIIDSKNLNFIE